MYTHPHTLIYVCVCGCVFVRCMCVYVCICVYLCGCVHTCMYLCMCVYVCLCFVPRRMYLRPGSGSRQHPLGGCPPFLSCRGRYLKNRILFPPRPFPAPRWVAYPVLNLAIILSYFEQPPCTNNPFHFLRHIGQARFINQEALIQYFLNKDG